MANTDVIRNKYYHSIKPKHLTRGQQEVVENFLWYILDQNSSCSHQNIVTKPYLIDNTYDILYEWILKKIIKVDYFRINTTSNPSCESDINSISYLNASYCYFFHDSRRFSLMEHFIKHVRNGFAHGAFNDEDWAVLCDYNKNHYMGCFIKLNKTTDYDIENKDIGLVPTLNKLFVEITNNSPIQTVKKILDIDMEIIYDKNIVFEHYFYKKTIRATIILDHQLTSPKERSIKNIKNFINSFHEVHSKNYSTNLIYVYVLPFHLNATYSNLNDNKNDYIILTKYLFHEFLDNKMNPEMFYKK